LALGELRAFMCLGVGPQFLATLGALVQERCQIPLKNVQIQHQSRRGQAVS